MAKPGAPSARWRRVTLETGNRTYHLSVQQLVDRAGVDQVGSWGMLLDREVLIGGLLRPAIEEHAATSVASWIVRGRNGESILASEASREGPITVTAGLTSDFLSWTLELHQPDAGLVETLLTSRRGVYLYAFLLLMGIQAFGLTLTARSVTQQLELARMKSDFVSTVSHEFKSPLTAIRQLAEMLQSGRVSSDEQRGRYYDVLLEQSERLSVLVDNVLDLARMDEGRYQLERATVDVGALLEQIVERVEQRVLHEGFTIRSEIEHHTPAIVLDAAAVTQATTNLIDNGVKYSGGAKEVVVRGVLPKRTLRHRRAGLRHRTRRRRGSPGVRALLPRRERVDAHREGDGTRPGTREADRRGPRGKRGRGEHAGEWQYVLHPLTAGLRRGEWQWIGF